MLEPEILLLTRNDCSCVQCFELNEINPTDQFIRLSHASYLQVLLFIHSYLCNIDNLSYFNIWLHICLLAQKLQIDSSLSVTF